jgi:type IV pilus assembly protein PilA
MFCSRCGHNNPEGNQFCGRCGQSLIAGAVASSMPQTPVMPDPDARTDGKAVASLILGIGGLTFFSIFAGIPAVILGHMSRSRIKQSMGKLKGEGMALAGLIMGYISFLAIPFILIIAAIAIPNLLRARISANESAAVTTIRSINVAAVDFSTRDPKTAMPKDLNQIVSSPESGLSPEIASGSHRGYRFTYTSADTNGDEVPDAYFVSAVPVTPGSTGGRNFCSDQSGVIRYTRRDEPCTTESYPL